jgi:hypothetical protein
MISSPHPLALLEPIRHMLAGVFWGPSTACSGSLIMRMIPAIAAMLPLGVTTAQAQQPVTVKSLLLQAGRVMDDADQAAVRLRK